MDGDIYNEDTNDEDIDDEETNEEFYEATYTYVMAMYALIDILNQFLNMMRGEHIERPLTRRQITSWGYDYIHKALNDDPAIFRQVYRMYPDVFRKLCRIIREKTPLEDTRFICVEEMLASFLQIVGQNTRYCVIRNTFGRSQFATSENFHKILKALNSLAPDLMEEVWEVVAQLVGLSLGILILDTPGLVKSYGVISLTWLSMRLLHLWLCYESLSVLQFNTINIKRARILVEALIKLYASEKYILMVNQQTEDLRFYVSFKVGATNVSVLRSVWQSFWLSENWDSDDNVRDQIATSLMELEEKFEDFIQKLKDAEWDTQQFNLKVLVELSYFREVDAHLLAHLSQKARNKWDFMEDSLHKSSDSRSIPTNERMHEQPEPIIESPEGLKMLEFRRSLPAFKEKDAFLSYFRVSGPVPVEPFRAAGPVVVVSGETGCGKTTQLPQYILESEIEAARGAVLVGAVVL
ncbi:hypothetical protein JHK87_018506 [Glycine soja]|nr:hypothetical protein JHK87_018506 [Glycine soja]